MIMARKRRSKGLAKHFKAGKKMRKAITARQKSARRKNISVARAAKKKGGKKLRLTASEKKYASGAKKRLAAHGIRGKRADKWIQNEIGSQRKQAKLNKTKAGKKHLAGWRKANKAFRKATGGITRSEDTSSWYKSIKG